ncbi:MAG: DinB family protein [Bacteroidia bacterium]
MSPSYAESLLQYDLWANNRVFEALQPFEQAIPDSILEIMSHILGAKQVWYNRAQEIPSTKDLFKKENKENLVKCNESLHQLWSGLIHRNEPNGMIIKYTNFAGEEFSNSLAELITHMVNHGSYHRGQVARITRESGHPPLATDFIIFSRK